MRNAICIFLIFPAIISAATQNTPSHDCVVNDRPAETLAQGYADRVNGLLRDTNANLQEISGRAAAGELTADQADRLKLAATRAMMARLETISAVYDAKIDSTNKKVHERNFAAGAASTQDATHGVFVARSTVSVEDLKRENGQ